MYKKIGQIVLKQSLVRVCEADIFLICIFDNKKFKIKIKIRLRAKLKVYRLPTALLFLYETLYSF